MEETQLNQSVDMRHRSRIATIAALRSPTDDPVQLLFDRRLDPPDFLRLPAKPQTLGREQLG